MKCPHCGCRTFMITTAAYQEIEFNKRDEIVYCETKELGGMAEDEGYLCLNCDQVVGTGEIIKENKA